MLYAEADDGMGVSLYMLGDEEQGGIEKKLKAALKEAQAELKESKNGDNNE